GRAQDSPQSVNWRNERHPCRIEPKRVALFGVGSIEGRFVMRPIRILLALSPLLIAAPAQQAVAQCKAATQLSGRWYGNDGGTYYLRRFGNEVWWVGISGDQGKSWTNAFHGTRNGDVITGEWGDVRGK